MLNLFKIERYKMRRFTPFYASMGFLVFLVIYDLIVGIKQSYIDAFPNGRMYDGFKDGISDLSFSFLIGMLIAWYVGIDFTNRTLHRVIVTGNPHRDAGNDGLYPTFNRKRRGSKCNVP